MQLVLVLPRLAGLRAAIAQSERAPDLLHLVAAAGAPLREADGVDAALAACYGIARQDDWPLAPIRLAALGGVPGPGYWLAADPVTLAVGRSDVSLAGIVDDLSRDDADRLVATLAAHFAPDGLTFVAPRPDAIFVRAATRARLATHPPAAALGRALHPLLPEGEDAGIWRRWQSEIEMLLHAHPVNVERERAGCAPANGIWFSGGGTLPAPPGRPAAIRTFAEAGIAVALAAHVHSPAHTLPADLDAARRGAGDATSIVVALAPTLDAATLEGAWAAPARAALRRGALDAVTLVGDDDGAAFVWHARRPGLWRRLLGGHARRDAAMLLGGAAGER